MKELLLFILFTCVSGVNQNLWFGRGPKTGPKSDGYAQSDFNTSPGSTKNKTLADIFKYKMQILKSADEVELIMLVDGSDSIGLDNFVSEMKFIQKVISDVKVGPKDFRLGVVTYSTKAVIHIDQLSVTDAADLEKCSLLNFDIPNINYPGAHTNTKEALEKAEKILTRTRMGALKVVFLISDGFSNMGDPLSAAEILKEQGTIIFTFGIKNGNVAQLQRIATKPVEEHSFLFDSFEEFEGFARRALHKDLTPGVYVPAKNSSFCDNLCPIKSDASGRGCCSQDATCSCGLISGHFACLCPPGHYGSGLVGEGCTLCPEGTYNEGLFPGDSLTCTPCPDVHHKITKYPAVSKAHCVCSDGTVAQGDKCKIVSCPPLAPPLNGYFVKKNCSNVINAACGVRCHMGYILTGSSIRICQKNGTWSGTEPTCRAKNCDPPKPVPGSEVTCVNDEDKFELTRVYDSKGNEIKPTEDLLPEDNETFASNLTIGKSSTSEYTVGTECSYKCLPGHSLIGSKSRGCLPMLKWSGLKPTCKSIKCPYLPEITSGNVKPKNCTLKGIKHRFGTVCKYFCDPGYDLKGPKSTNCTGKHGTWSAKNSPSRCVDVEPPKIDCPTNMSVKTDDEVHFATINLTLPNTTDNSGKDPIIWSKPPFDENYPLRLIIGETHFEIYSVDETGNYGFCSFTILVKGKNDGKDLSSEPSFVFGTELRTLLIIKDEEKPKVLECQSPPVFYASEFSRSLSAITWREPVFDDNSGIPISVTRDILGTDFPMGTTAVTYTGIDAAGNSATCTLNITILDNPCSERPKDTNTQWNCTIDPFDVTTCTISCAEGFDLAITNEENNYIFNCTFSGRRAYWTPDLFSGDVDLFPECSEMDFPEEMDEIIIEYTVGSCNDFNLLSDDLTDEFVSVDDNVTVFTICEDVPWDEEKENKSQYSIVEEKGTDHNLDYNNDTTTNWEVTSSSPTFRVGEEVQSSRTLLEHDTNEPFEILSIPFTNAVENDISEDEINETTNAGHKTTEKFINLSTDVTEKSDEKEDQKISTLEVGTTAVTEVHVEEIERFRTINTEIDEEAHAGTAKIETDAEEEVTTSELEKDLNLVKVLDEVTEETSGFYSAIENAESGTTLVEEEEGTTVHQEFIHLQTTIAGTESVLENLEENERNRYGTETSIENDEENKASQKKAEIPDGQENELQSTVTDNLESVTDKNRERQHSERKKRQIKGGKKRIRIEISRKNAAKGGKQNEDNGRKGSIDQNIARTVEVLKKLSGNGDRGAEGVKKVQRRRRCKAGSLLKNGFCVKCPKGTYHNVTISRCDPCPIGKYQETEGQSGCISCPPGFSTRKIRRRHSKQCKRICPPGTFGRKIVGSNLALAPCTPCPVGSYQPREGQTLCETCGGNLTTIRRGANSSSLCIDFAQFNDPCRKTVCRNGGTCFVQDGFALCKCLPGFVGSFCERIFDPCGSSPCYNGGRCLLTAPLGFSCQCLPGFQGDHCESEINECLSDPCQGRGDCTDLLDGFTCDCFPGFKGRTCEETINICEELNPCLNSGTCVETSGSYTCVCPEGFSGDHCDVVYDCGLDGCTDTAGPGTPEKYSCENVTCPRNQECQIRGNREPLCVCQDGFRGINCTQEINPNVVLRFPKYGVTEYLMSDFPDGDLSEISVCVWIKTKDTFNYGTIFSYATLEEDNSFTLTDYSGVVLYVSGRFVVTDLEANDGFWHFICVTWESENGRWQVYVDGSSFSNGTELSKGFPIPGNGKLVVGQEQDTYGGGFNDVESFAGRMTNFDVWDRVLKSPEIEAFYEDCDNVFGNLISWPKLLGEIHGDIMEEESMFCKTCESNLDVYRGVVTYDYSQGRKMAKYTCDEGYIIKFDDSHDVESKPTNVYERKCMKFGGWHRMEPKCGRISCGFPGYFPRGRVSGSSYKYQDTIVYHCSDGYWLDGNATRICTSDGTWSGEEPHCRGSQTECRKLTAPRHGSMFVYYNNKKVYGLSLAEAGDRVEFSCDKGYTLVGFSELTCIEGGIWDREPPTCDKIKCHFPNEIAHFLPFGIDANSQFYFADIISFTCPSGVRQIVKCGEFGNWNFTNNICKSSHCSNLPPNVRNGYIALRKPQGMAYGVGERLQVHCLPGFRMRGNDFFECSQYGTWIQRYPTICYRGRCGPPPPPPSYYRIVYEEGHSYGDKIFLSCAPGYRSFGEVMIQCQANGRYSRVKNKCMKISCGVPILPEEYRVKNTGSTFEFGSKIVVECPTGRAVSDISTVTVECLENGQWSSIPKCV